MVTHVVPKAPEPTNQLRANSRQHRPHDLRLKQEK